MSSYDSSLPSANVDPTQVVKAGDSFSKLAGGDVELTKAYIAANPGIDPRNLQVGQVINVPTDNTVVTDTANQVFAADTALESRQMAARQFDAQKFLEEACRGADNCYAEVRIDDHGNVFAHSEKYSGQVQGGDNAESELKLVNLRNNNEEKIYGLPTGEISSQQQSRGTVSNNDQIEQNANERPEKSALDEHLELAAKVDGWSAIAAGGVEYGAEALGKIGDSGKLADIGRKLGELVESSGISSFAHDAGPYLGGAGVLIATAQTYRADKAGDEFGVQQGKEDIVEGVTTTLAPIVFGAEWGGPAGFVGGSAYFVTQRLIDIPSVHYTLITRPTDYWIFDKGYKSLW